MELSAEAKYHLLLEVSQRVRDTLDLDLILEHILDTIQSILPYDAAGIFILNRDLANLPYGNPGHVIAGVARRGFHSQPPDSDPMLVQGRGIIGRVIQSGENIIIPDVHSHPDYVAGRQSTLSEIAVPVILHDRIIGALNIESDRLAAFTEDYLELLHFFADVVSISIEKVILHRQILEKELIDRQLQTACEVQSRLLPLGSPGIPGYDIAGICIPTEEIGGDYYDFVHLSHQRLGIAVADVSGHGVPAALVMTAFRALLRTTGRNFSKPARVARSINQLMPEFTADQHFVTVFFAVLDPEDGTLEYVSCGHPPAVLLQKDHTFILDRHGPALGVFPELNFPSGKVQMLPGDTLVMYTDGVVETTNQQGVRLGMDRLLSVLRSVQGLPSAGMIQSVVDHTRQFTAQSGYLDDFTLVIIRRLVDSTPL